MSLAATGAQAQETTNICGRTPQVRDVILALTPTNDACGSVLVSEMANIQQFNSSFNFPGSLAASNIESLKSGDFDGLDNLADIYLNHNQLMELPSGIFSGLSKLQILRLDSNHLNVLPDGIFSGLTSLVLLGLGGNPGTPFRFTIRFDPATLDEDFTTASVRLTLREGAPRPITVPVSATGATLSANSVSFTTGSVRSNAVTVTRAAPGSAFGLSQGEPELGGDDDRYTGVEIVPGPSVTTASFTHARVKVFLEGALE